MMTEKQTEQWAFETFAKLHPHEAYELNNQRFYDYVRTINPELSDKDIVNLLTP